MDVKKELEILEVIAKENESEEAYEAQKSIDEDILKIVEIIGKYDAVPKRYIMNIIDRIVHDLPLSYLEDKEEEWELVDEEEDKKIYRNTRYGFLFKTKTIIDGKEESFFVDAAKYMISEDGGKSWTMTDDYPEILQDRFFIDFPYFPEKPERVFIKIDEDGKAHVMTDEEFPF